MRTIKKDPPPRSGAAVQAATRSTDLADQLRSAILHGEILPGTQLRLDDLREKNGVSLSPVREALLKLTGEGYVVAADQRGFRVTPVSRANLEEVTVLRCLLEPLALRQSIAKGGDAWEDLVVASFHQLNRIEKSDDYGVERWEEAHRRFHTALIGACDMPLLLQQCQTLHNLSDRYRRIFLQRNRHDRNVPAEHRAIFDATMERDAEGASRLLSDHIDRTGRAVATYVSDRTTIVHD